MRPMPSEDEQQLVVRAKAGEERAFEELVRSHADHLYAVVVRLLGDRHEAEEVTQETFLRAWRGIGSFEGNSRFFTWLYRIGINEARRRAARNTMTFRASPVEERPGTEPTDLSEAPEPTATRHELQVVLEEAIAALDPDYRAPLVLRDVEGLSTSEAAEAMGLGEAAFKSRLHRARLAVRKAVDEYLGEER
ncbi:MAG: sigma-70 family RNA polymerase sigma factor [Actinobacteria bacterium]|nr:sigma-70 family RNA polymerase sigma factor [Actinomycetota bacterium]